MATMVLARYSYISSPLGGADAAASLEAAALARQAGTAVFQQQLAENAEMPEKKEK
jgi:hypothetical protein